ncbi:nucleotidyltransferase domain-containing protein [Pseudanabaena mucicola]|uniref:Nucleotidyltransferase domain-containing protein n=1 Tax=Pseudanabaena mucicola FACHB-723 TaxID=2692860 RepID=A0ABR7ZWN4_9CYAN|nr:nucleotidyltransferase domain-containing protein [Pseudanabaena mucicola]MBD2187944.1 nucleotidyltransferase domain-containing protein [Pseudanabaena mucicola FACHB-723]
MNTTEPEILRFGLKESTIDKIIAVFAKYPQIHKVILYGSRAKGNYRKGSDIDLTVIGEITYTDLAKIEDEIDDLFLPYTFDISIFSDIDNQDLIDHINRVGIVFYEIQQ